MEEFERIDLNTWKRRRTYEWFSAFSCASYGMDAEMDVTEVLAYARAHKCSFFLCMTYAVTRAMDSVPEFRMRLADGEPVLYKTVHPAYTVLDGDEVIANARQTGAEDLETYLRQGKASIDRAVSGALQDDDYNPENSWNEYYFTSLPWVNFKSVVQPMPDDRCNQTIPRICFGKYHEENGRYLMTVNFTVSHMFIDGLALCRAFRRAQVNCSRFPVCDCEDF